MIELREFGEAMDQFEHWLKDAFSLIARRSRPSGMSSYMQLVPLEAWVHYATHFEVVGSKSRFVRLCCQIDERLAELVNQDIKERESKA